MIAHVLGEVLVDLHGLVDVGAVPPVVEEDRADRAVEPAGEERQVAPGVVFRRRGEELRRDFSGEEVDLRERHVLLGVEAFRRVGVAQDSD